MIVRRARIEDAWASALVYARVAEAGFLAAEPPVDVAERAQRLGEQIGGDPPGAVWVLEDEGRIVGNAGAHERHPGVFSFGMAIVPEARGQGGGRALLNAIVEHARAFDAHKVELEVWVDNARAIAVYAAAGFEVEGLRRDHYRRRDGSLRSTLLMSRRLDVEPSDRPGG